MTVKTSKAKPGIVWIVVHLPLMLKTRRKRTDAWAQERASKLEDQSMVLKRLRRRSGTLGAAEKAVLGVLTEMWINPFLFEFHVLMVTLYMYKKKNSVCSKVTEAYSWKSSLLRTSAKADLPSLCVNSFIHVFELLCPLSASIYRSISYMPGISDLGYTGGKDRI